MPTPACGGPRRARLRWRGLGAVAGPLAQHIRALRIQGGSPVTLSHGPWAQTCQKGFQDSQERAPQPGRSSLRNRLLGLGHVPSVPLPAQRAISHCQPRALFLARNEGGAKPAPRCGRGARRTRAPAPPRTLPRAAAAAAGPSCRARRPAGRGWSCGPALSAPPQRGGYRRPRCCRRHPPAGRDPAT